MERKNKMMLIAAIGAAIVIVASSAVRCAATRVADEGLERDVPAIAETLEAEDLPGSGGGAESAEADGSSEGSEAEKAAGAEQRVLEILRSHAWQVEGDAETTVAFREGSFVESDATGVKVAAFEVTGANESNGHASLDVRIIRNGEEPLPSVVAVDGKDGSLSVSCDGFANSPSYVEGKAAGGPVAVEGVIEPYTTLIEGKSDELAEAVAAFCRNHVPTAAKATFDGEVFLDIPGKRVTATFHCDDKASTILSATYADGAFTVIG